MATNPKALELAKQGKVEYEWGTLWPHYHKEKMNWGGGFRTKGDIDILFLSGETGRDPFEDAPCRTPEEERAGRGKVVSHDVKVQGEPLAAGSYGVFMIPEKDADWTLIFSRDTNNWGHYYYDAAHDVLRVKVKPAKSDYHEYLAFEVPDRGTEKAT